jgi:hypothetical protein
MTPQDELREFLILLEMIEDPTSWDELDKALVGPRAEMALIYLRCFKDRLVAYHEAYKRRAADEITFKEFHVAMKRMTVSFDNLNDFLLD